MFCVIFKIKIEFSKNPDCVIGTEHFFYACVSSYSVVWVHIKKIIVYQSFKY